MQTCGNPPAPAGNSTKPRKRPLYYWKPLNDWWRDTYDEQGFRPSAQQVQGWYQDNAAALWGDLAPSIDMCLDHAHSLRSIQEQADYAARKKARKAGLPAFDLRRPQQKAAYALAGSQPPAPNALALQGSAHARQGSPNSASSNDTSQPHSSPLPGSPQGMSSDADANVRPSRRTSCSNLLVRTASAPAGTLVNECGNGGTFPAAHTLHQSIPGELRGPCGTESPSRIAVPCGPAGSSIQPADGSQLAEAGAGGLAGSACGGAADAGPSTSTSSMWLQQQQAKREAAAVLPAGARVGGGSSAPQLEVRRGSRPGSASASAAAAAPNTSTSQPLEVRTVPIHSNFRMSNTGAGLAFGPAVNAVSSVAPGDADTSLERLTSDLAPMDLDLGLGFDLNLDTEMADLDLFNLDPATWDALSLLPQTLDVAAATPGTQPAQQQLQHQQQADVISWLPSKEFAASRGGVISPRGLVPNRRWSQGGSFSARVSQPGVFADPWVSSSGATLAGGPGGSAKPGGTPFASNANLRVAEQLYPQCSNIEESRSIVPCAASTPMTAAGHRYPQLPYSCSEPLDAQNSGSSTQQTAWQPISRAPNCSSYSPYLPTASGSGPLPVPEQEPEAAAMAAVAAAAAAARNSTRVAPADAGLHYCRMAAVAAAYMQRWRGADCNLARSDGPMLRPYSTAPAQECAGRQSLQPRPTPAQSAGGWDQIPCAAGGTPPCSDTTSEMQPGDAAGVHAAAWAAYLPEAQSFPPEAQARQYAAEWRPRPYHSLPTPPATPLMHPQLGAATTRSFGSTQHTESTDDLAGTIERAGAYAPSRLGASEPGARPGAWQGSGAGAPPDGADLAATSQLRPTPVDGPAQGQPFPRGWSGWGRYEPYRGGDRWPQVYPGSRPEDSPYGRQPPMRPLERCSWPRPQQPMAAPAGALEDGSGCRYSPSAVPSMWRGMPPPPRSRPPHMLGVGRPMQHRKQQGMPAVVLMPVPPDGQWPRYRQPMGAQLGNFGGGGEASSAMPLLQPCRSGGPGGSSSSSGSGVWGPGPSNAPASEQ